MSFKFCFPVLYSFSLEEPKCEQGSLTLGKMEKGNVYFDKSVLLFCALSFRRGHDILRCVSWKFFLNS